MDNSKSIIKKVFISSTVYDLRTERKLIRSLLESFNRVPGIKFECLVSDHPNFPISPNDRTVKHSYDICLDNVLRSDYFVLLLKKRYGDPIVKHNRENISITHMEFRIALKKKIRRFVLVDKRTWDAKQKYKLGKPQNFIQSKHSPIFNFIDEIREKTKGNWIDFYSSKKEISQIINTFLDKYDDSTFISDITIPNGSIVSTNEKFTKKWEIQNIGLTIWENRFLREDNQGVSGLIPNSILIPIPTTFPGERVVIKVRFTAPKYPGSYESYWKMVDENGDYCFPSKVGLNCCVKVV